MRLWRKRDRRIIILTLCVISGLQLPGGSVSSSQAQSPVSHQQVRTQSAQTFSAYLPFVHGVRNNLLPDHAYVQTFDGDPANPRPWNDPHWDVTVHSRSTSDTLSAMAAQHGSDCSAPMATHVVTTHADAVYQCRNHVMTAINGSEYGAIYLTPNQMMDFSQGDGVIRFDMSTLRSSERDWVDVWITPFEDNVQLPLEQGLPDLQGEPRNAVHVRLTLTGPQNEMGAFTASVIRNFETETLPTTGMWNGYERVLVPDAARRDTFEIRMDSKSILVGMPKYNLWWVDATYAELGWTRGVVQFGHHSYNPAKCAGCLPNTWHWDNLTVAPAVPFTIINADQDNVSGSQPAVLTFPEPAPQQAYLRFVGLGDNLQVSFDGGVSWNMALQQQSTRNVEEHVKNYWMPLPAGTQQVLIRGQDWWGGTWYARDFTIWAR